MYISRRHSVKNLRPGGYYKIGVAAQNGDGWGPFTEWPLPVRIASTLTHYAEIQICAVSSHSPRGGAVYRIGNKSFWQLKIYAGIAEKLGM